MDTIKEIETYDYKLTAGQELCNENDFFTLFWFCFLFEHESVVTFFLQLINF